MRRSLVLLLLAAAACSSSPQGPLADPAPTTVAVQVTATSCTVDHASVGSGSLIFTISSSGAVPGSEVELLDGTRILGEEEAVHDGHVGGFTVQVQPSELQLLCLAGHQTVAKRLTVTQSEPRHISQALFDRQQQLKAAAEQWHTWVLQQLGQLVTSTKAFDDAVRAGDLARAKALYGPARVFYERVEPVAESFGDLDPAIDARIDDVEDPALWTGFHRLEKALFADGSLAGMVPYSQQLDIQVNVLANLAKGITVTPAELTSGAQGLLEEVARTKVTGEEERYSHLDLIDLAANVDGAHKAFSLIRPVLLEVKAPLTRTLDARFAALGAVLQALHTGSGPTDYPAYTAVTKAQRKQISDAVDGVAEAYSTVPRLLIV